MSGSDPLFAPANVLADQVATAEYVAWLKKKVPPPGFGETWNEAGRARFRQMQADQRLRDWRVNKRAEIVARRDREYDVAARRHVSREHQLREEASYRQEERESRTGWRTAQREVEAQHGAMDRERRAWGLPSWDEVFAARRNREAALEQAKLKPGQY